ncbi:hypothetical protein [Gimesia fumaroli]|uniref:Uncharacterized protein n=1 Tax=Gimesia fumaroli TaxID=2527976 RepID=A0A518IC17_9PLAN|nr:hypothetical protein [Gimesia fumaroli]QDV50642.1 hypothetical protein Enr17x_26840 [Gimesia fumaroli]
MFKVINNEWEFLLSDNTIHWNSMNGSSEDVYVYEENGHFDHSTGDFRLKSWLCNDVEDFQYVWQIGYELVGLLNGAFILYLPRMPRQKIEGLHENDERKEWYPDLSFPYIVREEVKKKLHKIKEKLPVPHSPALRLVQESLKNDDLYILVRLLGLDTSWVTLYQVYETIKHLSPETLKKSEVISSSENDKFRFTANNFSASGLDSRHGMQGDIPKEHKKYIPLTEATKIIRKICHDYIGTLVGEPFASIELPVIPGGVNNLGADVFTGEWFPD